MLERLSKPELAAISTILLLGASACGGSKHKPNKLERGEPRVQATSAPHVEVRYFSDGVRTLQLTGGNDQFGDHANWQTIAEFCDAGDLIEETEAGDAGYGPIASSSQRIRNYPACVDGRLTPSDFPTSAAEVNK